MIRAVVAFLIFAVAPAVGQDIHFVVPGGAGGGWDSTARGTGMVLRQEGLIDAASFENISGAGGGKAIAMLIETAEHRTDTLMVNSTPIIVRSITRLFPFSYRDLTPVARVIGDYQVLAVRADSEIEHFADLLARFRDDPRSVKVAGGSVRGDLDHLVPALALRAAGEDPRKLAYVPYDAGGKALAGFLTGEGDVLSTSLSEAMEYYRAGGLRIIVVSAPDRVASAPAIETYVEQGIDFEFVNWRGFFAAPGIDPHLVDQYSGLLADMLETPSWDVLRSRNGWQNLYLDRHAFTAFLAQQEHDIQTLLIELGFLREDGR
ncbi:MAG: tripartite tricarboxylate transporter substrate-binding protein [Pseudomonadota bacterium]|nr:tripartite tricarboxylate transporter substrate-binding protein [Pseudomonadota bacterium]